MKKLFMFLCLASLTLTIVAQPPNDDDDKKKKKTDMDLIFFGGFNYSKLAGNSDSDDKFLLGGHVGAGIQLLNFTKDLGLRSELIYSQQGDKYSYGEGSYGAEVKSRMNYLNLPIVACYRNKSGFFAEAGLQPGLLLSAKEKSTSTGTGNTGTTTTDIKDELNSFDLGVPIGAGFARKKIGICARLTPGILNVNKKDGNFGTVKERNFVFTLRGSYSL